MAPRDYESAIVVAKPLPRIASAQLRCHASVAHNQILNGASVIFSPFIGVELTSGKARTLPQVTAVFDPKRKYAATRLTAGH
jgi:hypothetical protein